MATKKKITFDITILDSLSELSDLNKELMSKAVSARKNAYAPYSQFQVGAAILLANGEIVIGNNQENACYPTGLCAERVAIFQAGALYPDVRIEAIAITAASMKHMVKTPVAPCGSCRQAISEYEFKQHYPIRLLFMGEQGAIVECTSIMDLLPLGFNSSYL